MRQLAIACLSLVLGSQGALASGGLSCEVADANLKLDVQSGVTHGMGGPFFSFKASVEILATGVHPDLKNLTLDDKLVHHWLDGDTLNLSFYQETAADKPHAYVEITVETEDDEEGSYSGLYNLTLFAAEAPADAQNPITLTGPATCFVE